MTNQTFKDMVRESIVPEPSSGNLYKVGQPVLLPFLPQPFLITGAVFDYEEWIWKYELLGGNGCLYPERQLTPYRKVRGEMKQLIRRAV